MRFMCFLRDAVDQEIVLSKKGLKSVPESCHGSVEKINIPSVERTAKYWAGVEDWDWWRGLGLV